MALVRIANARAEPIPVYAEMSSINPVYLLPAALAARAQSIAQGFVASLTMGAGQFCTNPGLVFGVAGADLDRFLDAAADSLKVCAPPPMLTPGIHQAYEKGVRVLAEHNRVETVARGRLGEGVNQGQGAIFATTANDSWRTRGWGTRSSGRHRLSCAVRTWRPWSACQRPLKVSSPRPCTWSRPI
jgi:NADP-dependent aldehyde dehydrogenase